METLPDDVVVEILVRVTDVAALFRCAATCKRCRLLIADPSFLRRRWPEGVSRPSSLLGFFAVQQPREEPTEGSSTATPMRPFTPVPWSPLGERHRFLTIPDLPRGNQAVVLTSRRGLVVSLDGPISNSNKTMILKVCDPIAGTSRQLPPLKCTNESFRIQGCTIITGADCCPTKRRRPAPSVYSSFKVLIISFDGRYNLHMFMSNESSWRTAVNWFSPEEYAEYVVPQQVNIVVCRGMAHWLFEYGSNDFYTLNVCANYKITRLSLTKLPVTPNHPGFKFSGALLNVTNDERLSLLGLYSDCTGVEIWTHQGDNKSEDAMADCWHYTKMIELKQPNQSTVECVCVSEMSGKLLVKDNQDCMYIVDLQTGVMETVTDGFCGIVMMAVPFEMDWPALLMSRLAGGRIKQNKLRGAISKIAYHLWRSIVMSILFGSIAMSRD